MSDAIDCLYSTIIGVAAQVEQAERQLKELLLEAARSGDCRRIERIVRRWLISPPCDVLSGIQAPENAHAEMPLPNRLTIH